MFVFSLLGCLRVDVVVMEKKRVDDHEVEPATPVRVDRFGFVKQEQNSAEGLTRSRSASEYERYEFYNKRHL